MKPDLGNLNVNWVMAVEIFASVLESNPSVEWRRHARTQLVRLATAYEGEGEGTTPIITTRATTETPVRRRGRPPGKKTNGKGRGGSGPTMKNEENLPAAIAAVLAGDTVQKTAPKYGISRTTLYLKVREAKRLGAKMTKLPTGRAHGVKAADVPVPTIAPRHHHPVAEA